MSGNSRKRLDLNLLSSMKLGLLLLLLLGIMASLGSFFPQGQPPGFYRVYYGELPGRLIVFLSLDHVYRSWWFLTLAALFALNTLTCSLKRIKKTPDLRSRGSVILHLSILVILAGAVISGVMARHTYVEIGTGKSLDLTAMGFPGYSLRVKEFKVEYYENLQPKQYISSVSLKTADGQEIEREIQVNRPLKYKGLKIYQASYGWLARGEAVINGKEVPFELASGRELDTDPDKNERLAFFFIPDFDEQGDTLHSRSPLPNNPRLVAVLFQDKQVMAREVLAEGETRGVGGYPVTFSGYLYYTGLEIKKDPGVGILYAGFVILLLGLVMRYLAPEKH
ncbi:cytochrome c biogenesis protein ResB [Moorella sulfitireducens (nom. illeg.)]|uniref:cytochrome c biogenesis protein ResB n=1 Tax=Neomoorella sulfitireducens TaxID=2972948 RepID=UPI0021ACED16|nr:cytochrome c biogenesis protein ResB [Moorella sulfitireducens]